MSEKKGYEFESGLPESHFYLNLIIRNKDAMIEDKVKEKAGRGIFGKMAGATANALISDEQITSKLTEGLKEKLEEATTEMGLQLDFETVFQKKNFVVCKVTLLNVDKATLLRRVKGDEFSARFEVLVELLREMEMEDKVRILLLCYCSSFFSCL